jgi:hypothetical protein
MQWLADNWETISMVISILAFLVERKRAQTNGTLARTLTGAIEVSEAEDVKDELKAAMPSMVPSVRLAMEAALAQTTDPSQGTPHKRSLGKELAVALVPTLIERMLTRRK